jgi:AraC family transcriptional regulator
MTEPAKAGTSSSGLAPPRFENGRTMLMAGFSGHFRHDNIDQLPALWQRFAPHIGHIPGQVEGVAYGICINGDKNGFDYMAGVEVSDTAALPASFERLTLPARRYAVFHHTHHISAIRQTIHAIWADWLPQSGQAIADAPFFERYDDNFDPGSGLGGIEIWLPLKA